MPPRITDAQWAWLLGTRARNPESIAAAYQRRRRPERLLGASGTLFLVAADHPARGAIGIGGDRLAMANRRSLLERLMTALANPAVSGVLGTPDVIEDLLLLGALEGKVVIGSMNRGGVDGAAWTMDDRFTAYDPRSIEASRLEGGKMLLRIDEDDAGTAATIESCGRAVSQLADLGCLALVEPLPYQRTPDGGHALRTDTWSLTRAVGIGSALGTTSSRTWLKMPSCDQPEVVFAATTLPCVVLGGAPGPDPAAELRAWERTLRQPTVRGLVVGRSLLYPQDGDVAGSVAAAARLLASCQPDAEHAP